MHKNAKRDIDEFVRRVEALANEFGPLAVAMGIVAEEGGETFYMTHVIACCDEHEQQLAAETAVGLVLDYPEVEQEVMEGIAEHRKEKAH